MTNIDNKIEKYLKYDKWYHGTTLFGWKKICELGVKYNYNLGNELDFGYGFYLTPKENQAESYITRLLQYKFVTNLGLPLKNVADKKIAVVIEFAFCPYIWYNEDRYNFHFLNNHDDDFANFVFHNRLNNVNGERHHTFDIIFGVMSDSQPTVLIEQFKNNEKTKEEVIEALKKPVSIKQLSLHKQELCDTIKPIRAYYIENEKKELNINDYCNK